MDATQPGLRKCLLFGLLSVLASVSCGEAPPATTAGAGGTGVPPVGGAGGGAGSTMGGSVGVGGSAGLAGIGGSAGLAGMGGSAGLAGMGGSAGTAGTGIGGGGGTVADTSCTFTIPPATTSSEIPTVGIVEFSTDLAGMTEAQIEFGLDTNYGMVAPVDLTEPNYRTLLLGMKQRNEYHFRIVATGPAGQCASPDQTIMSGSLPNGFPTISVTKEDGAAVYGGFLLTGAYVRGGGASGSPAYIADKDGDVVWAYNIGSDVTGARMSIDGKYMWINSAQVPEGNTNVHRVSMDGMTDENLSDQFSGQNHVMTVLPDESVAFFAYGNNGCDDVKIRRPDGSVETLINSGTATGSNSCHCNGIGYSSDDNSLVVSELNSNKYFKVSIADKSLIWVLGGNSPNDFTGDGANWDRQHGVHVLAADRLVFFNNGAMGSASKAVELLLDLGAMTATQTWTYEASSGLSNDIMGDVQRLKNGNTLVAYSTKGVLHEVSESGQLLEEWSWPIGGAFGYIEKRLSLYGPPER